MFLLERLLVITKRRKMVHIFLKNVYVCTWGKKNVHAYRKGEDWWLMEATGIICNLEQPTPEKVTDKCIVYYFKDIDA